MEPTQPRNRKRSEVLLLLAPVLVFVALMAIERHSEHREAEAEAQFRAELSRAKRNSMARNHMIAQISRLKEYKAQTPIGSDRTAILGIEQLLDQQLLALDEQLENEVRQRRGMPLLKTTSIPTPVPTPIPTPTPRPIPMPKFQLLSGAAPGAATKERNIPHRYNSSNCQQVNPFTRLIVEVQG